MYLRNERGIMMMEFMLIIAIIVVLFLTLFAQVRETKTALNTEKNKTTISEQHFKETNENK